jgi:adenosylcobinamide kinase/adenosylcobinamide-phosphate guanylyltransferase
VIWLLLGGARSGKSELAERHATAAAAGKPVTYIATGSAPEGDDDFAARIARHRARRPPDWETIELPPAGDLAGALGSCATTALVDSLGTWVAGVPAFAVETEPLVACLRSRREGHLDTFLVSEEVGLGVHPSTELGRQFRDALGDLNRAVGAVSDRLLLVVAGRALTLEGEG